MTLYGFSITNLINKCGAASGLVSAAYEIDEKDDDRRKNDFDAVKGDGYLRGYEATEFENIAKKYYVDNRSIFSKLMGHPPILEAQHKVDKLKEKYAPFNLYTSTLF